jgi:hypothetical protein
MTDLQTRETPATLELCPVPTVKPEKAVDPAGWAAYLNERGIQITERQAVRQFAERGFPRFAVGKRYFALPSAAWVWLTDSRR